MKTTNRAYSDSKQDFNKLWDFLIEDYRNKAGRFVWSLGRLCDWKYGLWDKDKKTSPHFFENNAQLWVNVLDEVEGFVLSEEGDESFALFAKEGCTRLYDEMIDFVEVHWSRRGSFVSTEVHANQVSLQAALEKRGFGRKPSGIRRRYDLRNCDTAYDLDEAYRIVAIAENEDYFGKRRLQKNGFRNTDEVTDYDMTAYAYNRESPVYNPKYDLSVVDHEGRHLSGCLAFVDDRNSYAEIERVCTHPDYRRKGLCVAVIRECFKRLQSENIKTAFVTGYSEGALGAYRKLGATEEIEIFEYRK
jgi:ribosomal protein S18 acetylase RimI-like enzyme